MSAEVRSVTAAVRVLEHLASAWPSPVQASDLVTALGLNRSTCYNILTTLQQAGWVASKADRSGWTLGPRLLTLTGVSHGLSADVVQEEIDELSRRLGFVVFAAEKDGSGGYTVTAVAEQRSGVRVTAGVGDRFPFSAPALMHAFHAWTDPMTLDRLIARYGVTQFTNETVTERHDLDEVLRETRAVGYSQSIGQYNVGHNAAAACAFDRNGVPTIAICVLAFASDLTDGNIAPVGAEIRACAERITHRLGGVAPSADGLGPTPQVVDA